MLDQTDLMVLAIAIGSIAAVLILGAVVTTLGTIRMARTAAQTEKDQRMRERLALLNRAFLEETREKIANGHNQNATRS